MNFKDPVKILLVEGSPVDEDLTKQELSKLGARVSIETANSFQSFQDKVQTNKFDLIISELSFKEYEVRDALDFLNKNQFNSPLIVLSSKTISCEDEISLLKIGAKEFLEKQNLTKLHFLAERELGASCCVKEKKQLIESYKLIFDNIADAVFAVDIQGENFVYFEWNHKMEEIFKIDKSFALGKTPDQIFEKDFSIKTHLYFQDCIREKSIYEYEDVFQSNGKMIFLHTKLVPVFNLKGKAIKIIGCLNDITSQKATELTFLETNALLQKEIKEKELKNTAYLDSKILFQSVFNNAGIGIAIIDSNGCFINTNEEYCKIVGYDFRELNGREYTFLLVEDERDISRKNYQDYKQNPQESYQVERKLVHKSGKIIHTLATAGNFLTIGGDRFFVFTILDRTEEKKIQEELAQTNRLNSIGSLAGGIAHDFNNILSPIFLGLDVIGMKIQDEKLLNIVNRMKEASQRGANLISQILTFAKGQDGEKEEIDLKSIIDELRRFLKETIPKNISLKIKIDDDLHSIVGDVSQIHQILLNLCVNARDAMPEGGCLSIEAKNINIDESMTLKNPDLNIGSYLKISVLDTGTGISKDVLDKIFNPFFTTKEKGKGTGLGLSTVMNIVKKHDGFMDIQTELGKGSIFNIYLPATMNYNKSVVSVTIETDFQNNGETILIIEDEGFLRDSIAETLENRGFSVIKAKDGVEGIAIYSMDYHKISLILVDMMMPILDGASTIGALKSVDPDVKIIAMSGFMDDEKFKKLTKAGIDKFLKKPYTEAELLSEIQVTLK